MVNNHVNISYINDRREDLLNPATDHAIHEAQVDVYYRVHGEEKRYIHPNLDHPRSFRIWRTDRGSYLMTFYFATEMMDRSTGRVTAIIRYKGRPQDVLTGVFDVDSPENIKRLKRVFQNEKLVWGDHARFQELQPLVIQK